MGFFSRFERSVEDGFDGMGDKLSGSPISPVQIAKKAEKQMRREKMVGAGKEFAPTLYTVLVNPDDDQRLFGYYPTLAGETETYLKSKAQENGLVLDGAPLVRFIVDDELKHGKFDVVAELVSSPIVEQLRAEELQRYGLSGAKQPQPNRTATPQTPATAQPYQPAQPANPYANPAQPARPYASTGIDVMVDDPLPYEQPAAPTAPPVAPITPNTGQTVTFNANHAHVGFAQNDAQQVPRLIDLTTNHPFPLTKDKVVIGRALSSDLTVEDLNASRTHAELRHEGTTAWSISDLGSTNGTLVNGRHIASTMLQEGDRITVGATTFLFTFQ